MTIKAQSIVPRAWPCSTVAILATGPSLRAADAELCREVGCRVLAIKDAIRIAPLADAMYFSGADAGQWWQRNRAAIQSFQGLKFTLDRRARELATVIASTGELGLELDPSGVRTGRNSGYQAINVAVHLGASRVILLGYDMHAVHGRDHWFGAHPYQTTAPYDAFLRCFESIVAPLQANRIDVVNATPDSSLTCFPIMTLTEAITTCVV